MSILLIGLLAGASVFPDIDRRALDIQAKAEAARGRPVAKAARPAPKPVSRVRASLRANDVQTLVTICGAAANLHDSADFLNTLGKAYAMPAQEIAKLRGTCAIYSAGRAHARQASFARASF